MKVFSLMMLFWRCALGASNSQQAESLPLSIHINVDNAKASSTAQSEATAEPRSYGAQEALSRGTGYWCSEGNHGASDVVWFAAYFRRRRSVKSVTIYWAYAPEQVRVLASTDGGEPYRVVVDWTSPGSSEREFRQEIVFPHSETATSFRLEMKGAVHKYFGINFLQFAVQEDVTVRLQSGVTSGEQMCLQYDAKMDVILDSCIASIATMDGRDLWRFNEKSQIYNPFTDRCIALKDNRKENGGEVVMEQCEELASGSSAMSWELQANNQLKLLGSGDMCLSFQGNSAGKSDIAANKKAACSHPYSADASHEPNMAVDGSFSTFWLSELFTLAVFPTEVTFDIPLEETFKIDSVLISWAYAPAAYSILTSQDGKEWVEAFNMPANTVKTNMCDLQMPLASHVRISMKKPHPKLGAFQDKVAYGIRTVSVYANRLRSIVEPCEKAALTKDARDKFFLEYVSEIDLNEAVRLRQQARSVVSKIHTIQDLTIQVSHLADLMQTCLSEKKSRQMKVSSVGTSQVEDLRKKLNTLKSSLELLKETKKTKTVVSSSKPGMNAAHPLDDCIDLHDTPAATSSGFFWIHPHCLSKPVRAFCDNVLGTSVVVSQDTGSIKRVPDVAQQCAHLQLLPLVVQSKSQVKMIQSMLMLMQIDLSKPVPIGARGPDGKFYAVGTDEPLNEELSSHAKEPSNIIGIGIHGLTAFDGQRTDMSAILCSTNVNIFNKKHVFKLSCEAKLVDISAAPADSAPVRIRCPTNCACDSGAVYGTDVYAANSAVCIAAMHSGKMGLHGDADIKIVEFNSKFIGSKRNCVTSDDLQLDSSRMQAFEFRRVKDDCPA